MKATLGVLLALFIALSIWLAVDRRDMQKIIVLRDKAIKADQDYRQKLQTTPVPIGKHRETGDLYVSVPYLDKPLRYPKVCMPELKL